MRPAGTKKADVVGHLKMARDASLLVDRPPDLAGLPLTVSSDIFDESCWQPTVRRSTSTVG